MRYASPNAVSALHRVGITANALGMRLAELGLQRQPGAAGVRDAAAGDRGVRPDRRDHPAQPVHADPRPAASVTGGLLLLRDVTEVRKRDKLLLSKDATIREIHHRVKNNLQTISSLLRLQGRRLYSAEAKAAVAESVRRIRTIALVHETLSREAGRRRRVPRDRATAAAPGRGGPAVAGPPDAVHRAGRRRAAAHHDRHAAVGRADRAAAERRSITGSPRAARAATWSCSSSNDGERAVDRGRQRRRRARPRRSSSTRRPASACRSCARW